MAKKITIAIQKGGVGKTATVKNLAASLALHDKKVLVLDLDPQANATTGLGIDPYEDGCLTLVDVFTSKTLPAKDAIVEVTFDRDDMTPIHILPSHRELSDVIRSMTPRQTGMVKSLLSEIEHDYDFVVIDTPPTASLATVNSLIASDLVLIPVTPEVDALNGVVEILRAVDEVRIGLNPDLSVAGILPTMVRKGTSLSVFALDQLRTNYPTLLIEDYIPLTVGIGDSVLYRMPFVIKNPEHEAAQNYLKLARRFI
jgi:chromosome partitioning protein